MNNLPYAFYESVFWVGWTQRNFAMPRVFITAKELSGTFGIVAKQITSMLKYHVAFIRNNRISFESRQDPTRRGEVPERLWIEKDEFISSVTIYIFECNEDKVSREVTDRISFPNAMYSLALETATVTKAWIDWACRSKRLTSLCIFKKLNAEAIDLCKRLIETGHVATLHADSEAFSEGAMEMMKLSLTQPQFKSLRFTEDDHLEELLVFWSQNKEALRGKDLYFKTTRHVKFLEGKLELCPQEKFKPIGRHHFYYPLTLFWKPSRPYKLKYCGDDGDSHNAYVFFNCVLQEPEESEMSCFARTPQIGILFT